MNNDLISREALKEAFRNNCFHNCYYCKFVKWDNKGACHICGLIDNAPPITDHSKELVQKSIEIGRRVGYFEEKIENKRPHGKWITQSDVDGFTYWKCSECNKENDFIPFNYCPNCGAKMDGEEAKT